MTQKICIQFLECCCSCGPGLCSFLSGKMQEFLQWLPEGCFLLRFAVRNHISTPFCTQPDGRPHQLTALQPCLCDVPTEVHLHLLQAVAVCFHTLQAAVGDADAVLQVESAQSLAALQHRDHILVGDVRTAGQRQWVQIGAPGAQKAINSQFKQSRFNTEGQRCY